MMRPFWQNTEKVMEQENQDENSVKWEAAGLIKSAPPGSKYAS